MRSRGKGVGFGAGSELGIRAWSEIDTEVGQGILGFALLAVLPPTLSAKDAERMGHPTFICDLADTGNGWATRQSLLQSLIQYSLK